MRFAGATAASEDERLRRNEAHVLRNFLRKLGGIAAKVPFVEDLLTVYYCAFDRTTPAYVRLALLAALAYFIDPFDTVPDVLPLIGLGDDAAVLASAIKLTVAHIKPEHREAARETLTQLDRAA